MRKLVPLLTVAALAFAIGMSGAAPYQLAAKHRMIDQSPAAEVIKIDAQQQAMQAALDQPTLSPMSFEGIVNPNTSPTVRYHLRLS